jgi:two-component system, sensor histidine kinase
VTRILLVEDNVDAREALRALLELDGYEVHAAADGTEGLELARTKAPNVALIDIGLPGIDGYEVARRMKLLVAPAPMMIALTGYSEPEDKQRAKDAGFCAHLVKPVDPETLARLLATLEIPGPGSRG